MDDLGNAQANEVVSGGSRTGSTTSMLSRPGACKQAARPAVLRRVLPSGPTRCSCPAKRDNFAKRPGDLAVNKCHYEHRSHQRGHGTNCDTAIRRLRITAPGTNSATHTVRRPASGRVQKSDCRSLLLPLEQQLGTLGKVALEYCASFWAVLVLPGVSKFTR